MSTADNPFAFRYRFNERIASFGCRLGPMTIRVIGSEPRSPMCTGRYGTRSPREDLNDSACLEPPTNINRHSRSS